MTSRYRKGFREYPEFGSEDFVKWLSGHPMKKLRRGMRRSRCKKRGTRQLTRSNPVESDAEVPAFGTDAFWAWLYEDAAEMVDGEWLYDMDAILSWMVKAGYENAYDFIQEFF